MSLFGLNTSNPAFSNYFWKHSNTKKAKKMTLSGVILKSIFCLLLVTASAAYTWKLFFEGVTIQWYTTGGIIVALVCSIVISVRREWTMPLTLIYAVAKGFFIGGFSAYIHQRFPYLPFQAVIITLLTFFVMLLLYMTRIIKVTKKFRSVVITVISVIFLVYITSFILNFFGIHFSFLWDSSWIAIAFNVVVAIFASLSLLLDFDFMDRYIGRAKKHYEWFATWGLLVTIIWLYVEVLRLLKKLAIRF
ncbi:Bax inhibitor-1/YccA family protein [uncultured Kordia sp.]|uniref:Bax inhibitor-1/YccA family protein n=1 Tax=uncultured Kordia sp. TaxID=507699 RepID=UPI002604C4FA|nr:Bax inhibitor-1/YccA family protein [uncultured Kordia sp.]